MLSRGLGSALGSLQGGSCFVLVMLVIHSLRNYRRIVETTMSLSVITSTENVQPTSMTGVVCSIGCRRSVLLVKVRHEIVREQQLLTGFF